MENIDEKRLSALLERISAIKVEIEALENDVRGLCSGQGTVSPVLDSAAQITGSSEARASWIPAEKPVETDVPAETTSTASMPGGVTQAPDPADEPPIDIDITGVGLTKFVEDPAAEYSQEEGSPVSKQQEAASTASDPLEAPRQPETPAHQVDDDLPFDDDLPAEEPSPAPRQTPEQEQKTNRETEPGIQATKHEKQKPAIIDNKSAETAVMDVMAEKQAWRTDRPGTQVKNVISAISLNDRVLLINVLFREDPILFQNTISAFNGMASLNEAVAYIQANFPEWDLNSEPVYRLMMAVRRRLR